MKVFIQSATAVPNPDEGHNIQTRIVPEESEANVTLTGALNILFPNKVEFDKALDLGIHVGATVELSAILQLLK